MRCSLEPASLAAPVRKVSRSDVVCDAPWRGRGIARHGSLRRLCGPLSHAAVLGTWQRPGLTGSLCPSGTVHLGVLMVACHLKMLPTIAADALEGAPVSASGRRRFARARPCHDCFFGIAGSGWHMSQNSEEEQLCPLSFCGLIEISALKP